ncbi:MAG: hypothetical protein ACE14L_05160 [Terriglobales bacterium]
MPIIWSLRPNVTREEAVAEFKAQGFPPLTRLLRGRLHSTADLYVPFGIFRVEMDTGGRNESSIFGLDLVCGDFDLYRFNTQPAGECLIQAETRNAPPALLDATAAQELVTARIRRLVARAAVVSRIFGWCGTSARLARILFREVPGDARALHQGRRGNPGYSPGDVSRADPQRGRAG